MRRRSAAPGGGRSGLTAKELEESTGFDRRTIAYYVQEGLLPRVGRRGPRTRYPTYVRDRLLFIRRVRDAEETGDLPPISLAELGEAFARLPRGVVAAVADGAVAVSKELFADEAGAAQAAASRVRSAAARQRALEERLRLVRRSRPNPAAAAFGELDGAALRDRDVRYSRTPPSAARAEDAPADHGGDARTAAVLGITLAAVSDAARRREEASPDPVDTWMRAEVVPGVELSVRGATEEDMELLEQAAASLRRLVSGERRTVPGAATGDQ